MRKVFLAGFVGVIIAVCWAASTYLFTGEIGTRFIAGGIGATAGSFSTLLWLK